MARKPRVHYPGAAHNAMLWGNACEAIFFEEADREGF